MIGSAQPTAWHCVLYRLCPQLVSYLCSAHHSLGPIFIAGPDFEQGPLLKLAPLHQTQPPQLRSSAVHRCNVLAILKISAFWIEITRDHLSLFLSEWHRLSNQLKHSWNTLNCQLMHSKHMSSFCILGDKNLPEIFSDQQYQCLKRSYSVWLQLKKLFHMYLKS